MLRERFYLIAILVLLLDHITKWLARTSLYPDRIIELIPGYLRFSYVCNTGVAFGFFDEIVSVWKPYILAGLAIIAIVVILIYSVRTPSDRMLLHVALAITTGGILGNFLDRIFRGFVVDFIEFHVHESFYFPTFNIADSAITIGIALLLLDTVKNPGMETAPEPPAINDHS
jgi:signal peptidase II